MRWHATHQCYSVAASGIFIWWAIARGSGDESPPVLASRDKASVGGLGRKTGAVCRHCLQIMTAETTKIWNFTQFASATSMFHSVGVGDPFPGAVAHGAATSLTPDEELNILIHETFFYVDIFRSYKLSKTVCFLAHPYNVRYGKRN